MYSRNGFFMFVSVMVVLLYRVKIKKQKLMGENGTKSFSLLIPTQEFLQDSLRKTADLLRNLAKFILPHAKYITSDHIAGHNSQATSCGTGFCVNILLRPLALILLSTQDLGHSDYILK